MIETQSCPLVRPGPRKLHRLLSVGSTALVTTVLQLLIFNRSVVPLDEGQLVTIGYRILGGEVLYADIYTGIFPGVYYAAAALLGVFGADIVVTRVAQAVVNVLTAVLLYLIGERLLKPRWALIPPFLYASLAVVSFPVFTFFAYSSLALLFALLALWFTLRYLEAGTRRDGAAIGIALAACALTKQNYGVFVGAPILAGLLFLRSGGALSRQGLARVLLPVVGAGALCTAAALGALGLAGAGESFVRDTILTVFRAQMDAFNQPIPPIFGTHPGDGRFTFFYLPGALFNYLVRGETLFGQPMSEWLRGGVIRLSYGLTLLTLIIAPLCLFGRRRAEGTRRWNDAVLVVLFGEAFFLGMFPSAIWSHLSAVLAPVFLLAAIVAGRVEALLGARRTCALAWRAAVWAITGAAVLVCVRIGLDVRRWYSVPLGIERGSLYVSADQAELLRAGTAYLQTCASRGESVFVAPDMPVLYFLADRRNPTPFDLIIPGDIDVAGIIARLEETRTRCVVYNPRMYLHFDSFETLFPDLAAYLRTRFHQTTLIGRPDTGWLGLERKESST